MNTGSFILGSAKVGRLMKERFEEQSVKLKGLLCQARRVTICLDGWSKKSLSSSFLGMSACFFNPTSHKPEHVFLSLVELPHPHTGEAIADCLSNCLKKWGINENQVILVVSDNGSNMLKALRVIKARHAASEVVEDAFEEGQEEVEVPVLEELNEEEDSFEDDESQENGNREESSGAQSGNDGDGNDELDDSLDLPQHVPYRRMQCMAHTLQLLIKPVYIHYNVLLTKIRHLVGRLRKSSVAMEKLVSLCGRTVVNDCTTRWNSTYHMIQRLLAIKSSITTVLAEMGIYYCSFINT